MLIGGQKLFLLILGCIMFLTETKFSDSFSSNFIYSKNIIKAKGMLEMSPLKPT